MDQLFQLSAGHAPFKQGIKKCPAPSGQHSYIFAPIFKRRGQVPDMNLRPAQVIRPGNNKDDLNRPPTSSIFHPPITHRGQDNRKLLPGTNPAPGLFSRERQGGRYLKV